MKRFYTLLDAINYQTDCPICHKKLRINDRHAELKVRWRLGAHQEQTLVWKLADSDELIVNLQNNHIEMIQKTAKMTPVYEVGSISPHYIGAPIYDGILYERLGVECDSCCQYSFLIRVQVDVGRGVFTDIQLNSEYLTIDSAKGTVYEIKNVYTTEETEFTILGNVVRYPTFGRIYSSDKKRLTLPLIPIDLQNPEKTLERIKTLVLFS